MSKFPSFLGILLILLLSSSLLIFFRFFIFNSDFKENWGIQEENIIKTLSQESLKKLGEKTVFSLPLQYVDELDIDLVGEDIKIYQDPEIKTIEVEVFYSDVKKGIRYKKVPYQLFNKGDVAFLKTDRNLWKKWKNQFPHYKLLVGFITVKVPKDFSILKITSASGNSRILGDFKEIRFSSLSGGFFHKGSIQKGWLNTWQGDVYLEGSKISSEDSFININFNTFWGRLTGKGHFHNMTFNSLKTTLDWQGSGRRLKGRSFFLTIKASLFEIIKSEWDIISISSILNFNIPKNSKSYSNYGLGKRYEVFNNTFHINLRSLYSSFNRSYLY